MIRRKEEATVIRKKFFGGEGEGTAHQILNTPEEFYGKGRLFNHLYLDPGAEIGWHIHHGDGETYYILKGEGDYSDNGNLVHIKAGDTTFCDAEEGHSLKNTGDGILEAIALILYK